MRTGIVGNIYGYHDGTESHGQGIQADAAALSREFPEHTISHNPLNRNFAVTWYERATEIEEPYWANPDPMII